MADNPFGPGGRYYDLFKRYREQQEMIRLALGPGHEIQQRIKSMQTLLGPLADYPARGVLSHISDLQNSGVLATAAQMHSERINGLRLAEAFAWTLALQQTALSINRASLGNLDTQRLIAASAGPDVLKLARTFESNQSSLAALMAASNWTNRFRALTEGFANSLAGIRLAAESARLVDMTILRASANLAARTSTAIAADQVLEAHRLIEAIGQADTPYQSAGLFTALVSLIAALFERFGENTMDELRGIGAIRLLELFMLGVALFHFAAPDEMSPAEKKVHAEVKVELETLEEKIDKILAANEAANEAYISALPRAELNRAAAIRRDAQGKAPVLLRGDKGTPLAVKEAKGRWRLVVFRDPLTAQLSEGWVHAPAISLLNSPTG